MPQKILWTDPEGSDAVKLIVSRRIPQWKEGLRDFQQEYIPYILNGDNLLICTAMGDGKSCFFTVPILVHLEVRDNPDLYKGFEAKKLPVGIIVTPTIGLAGNIVRELITLTVSYNIDRISQVSELSRFNISALNFCHDTVTISKNAERLQMRVRRL